MSKIYVLNFKLFFLFLGLIFITSCKDDDSGLEIIYCHRSVIEGTWDVESKSTTHYETQDSIVELSNTFIHSFFEDGTGSKGDGTGNFTWSLQCSPDVILINKLGGSSIEENPTSYRAFSELWSINSITNNEIRISIEHLLGEEETKRKIQSDRTYTRVD